MRPAVRGVMRERGESAKREQHVLRCPEAQDRHHYQPTAAVWKRPGVGPAMSALGQKQTLRRSIRDVRFTPESRHVRRN
jgi:hypothetical protein